MSKKILYNTESRDALKRGVDKLANAVSVTLGPNGRNVVIQKQYGSPLITKDGVSVAKEIQLEDPVENMGAQMVIDVASKTNDVAGDGTTTATVLAQSIVSLGLKNVTAGANPMELKKGIERATNSIISELERVSIQIDDYDTIAQVGTISANGDESIGRLIADAVQKVGKDGVITVEEANGIDTYLETVEGMQFDKGYVSPHFITNQENLTVELDNPLVLLYDGKITSVKDILKILEGVSQSNQSLLIIADEVDGEALAALVVNKLRGILNVAAVKAPGFGDRRKEVMNDISVLINATYITSELGYSLEGTTLDMLGSCGKVVIDKDSTTIINGGGSSDTIKTRIETIQKQIEKTTSDYERGKLQERLAKLSGGVAVLYIGAVSEMELKEKKDRVDDALHATRAAVAEGIVPGGGVALLRASSVLDGLSSDSADERIGFDIIRRAVEQPLRTIANNGGVEGSVVVQTVKGGSGNYGWNARTNTYGDLIADGVIDPTKVTRTALQNAASVAGLLLTTEAVVYEEKKKDDDSKMSQPSFM
jgi:chaperonin GroEL